MRRYRDALIVRRLSKLAQIGEYKMSAYLIVDVNVTDAARFADYRSQVPAFVARHGGEYLVVGGTHDVAEGSWHPSLLVLIRFPDRAAIHAFLNDPEYLPLKTLRQQSAETSAIAVDGIN